MTINTDFTKLFVQVSFTVLFFICGGAAFAQHPQLTNLPTLYITTTGNKEIEDKVNYVEGALTIVAAADVPGQYIGAIDIRLRGNSTFFFSKKPYRIRLATKTRILGMPANERSWVLLANAMDNTLLRNAVAVEMSKYIGMPFTCSYRLVDVVVNGEYKGNYTLTDQVAEGNDRVVLDKLDNTMITEPGITGGYMVQHEMYADQEPSYFRTTRGMAFSVKYPDDEDINSTQFDYIKGFIQGYETKLFSSDFLNPTTGYRPITDRISQVNWYIACELSGNPDSYLSIYMVKKRNDPKLYYGPLWDFDAAFNNYYNKWPNEWDRDATYKRMSLETHGAEYPQRLLLDPEFKLAVKNRWNELKSLGIEAFLDDKITELYNQISASQVLNKQIWEYFNPNSIPNINSIPYIQFIEDLRAYTKRRVAYLDQQFNDEIRTDMYYKLLNRGSQKVIDLNNTTDQQALQRSESENLTQQWKFIPVDVGGTRYYKIENRETKNLLSSINGSTGTQLQSKPDASADNQLWQPIPAENNVVYGFSNKSNNLVIENLTNNKFEGNAIIQSSSAISNAPHRQWTFVPYQAITGPLPVTIVKFEAKAKDAGIRLNWEVTENLNGYGFVIERTSDPGRIKPDSIGQVLLGEGDIGVYSYLDTKPLHGMNYYRLKIIDQDGSVSYSRLVREYHAVLQHVNIFPQPATESISLSFQSDLESPAGQIEILNLAGQRVSTGSLHIKKGNNRFEISTKNLSHGVYEILLHTENQVTAKKLIISGK
jgi:hypothetical protein